MHDVETLYRLIAQSENEIEQYIANIFPEEFPLYPDEWGAGDDRCVGEHIPITMVMHLATEYEKLRDVFDAISSHGKVTIDARSTVRRGVAVVQVKHGSELLATGASVQEALLNLRSNIE